MATEKRNSFGASKLVLPDTPIDISDLYRYFGVPTTGIPVADQDVSFQTILGKKGLENSGATGYPDNKEYTQKNAALMQILYNIAGFIGETDLSGTLCQILESHERKLSTSVDPSLLISTIFDLLGSGIYNNGVNGTITGNEIYNPITRTLKLRMDKIRCVSRRRGVDLVRDIGPINISSVLNLGAISSGTVVKYFDIGYVVNNVGTVMADLSNKSGSYTGGNKPYEFLEDLGAILPTESQPPVEYGAEFGEEYRDFYSYFFNASDLNPTQNDEYSKFVNVGSIIKLYSIKMTFVDGVLYSFEPEQKFTPINASIYYARNVLNCLAKPSSEMRIHNSVVTADDGRLEYAHLLKLKTIDDLTVIGDNNTLWEFLLLDADNMFIKSFDIDKDYLAKVRVVNGNVIFTWNEQYNPTITLNDQEYNMNLYKKIAIYVTARPAILTTPFSLEFIANNNPFKTRIAFTDNIKSGEVYAVMNSGHLWSDISLTQLVSDPYENEFPLIRTNDEHGEYVDYDRENDDDFTYTQHVGLSGLGGELLRHRSVSESKLSTESVSSRTIRRDAVLNTHINQLSMNGEDYTDNDAMDSMPTQDIYSFIQSVTGLDINVFANRLHHHRIDYRVKSDDESVTNETNGNVIRETLFNNIIAPHGANPFLQFGSTPHHRLTYHPNNTVRLWFSSTLSNEPSTADISPRLGRVVDGFFVLGRNNGSPVSKLSAIRDVKQNASEGQPALKDTALLTSYILSKESVQTKLLVLGSSGDASSIYDGSDTRIDGAVGMLHVSVGDEKPWAPGAADEKKIYITSYGYLHDTDIPENTETRSIPIGFRTSSIYSEGNDFAERLSFDLLKVTTPETLDMFRCYYIDNDVLKLTSKPMKNIIGLTTDALSASVVGGGLTDNRKAITIVKTGFIKLNHDDIDGIVQEGDKLTCGRSGKMTKLRFYHINKVVLGYVYRKTKEYIIVNINF